MGRVEPSPMRVASDGHTVVTTVGPPETRAAVPVTSRSRVYGQRVVWFRKDGWHFDYRAATNPYQRATDDRLVVDIVPELDWYAWQLTGARYQAHTVPASTVFVERPDVSELLDH